MEALSGRGMEVLVVVGESGMGGSEGDVMICVWGGGGTGEVGREESGYGGGGMGFYWEGFDRCVPIGLGGMWEIVGDLVLCTS